MHWRFYSRVLVYVREQDTYTAHETHHKWCVVIFLWMFFRTIKTAVVDFNNNLRVLPVHGTIKARWHAVWSWSADWKIRVYFQWGSWTSDVSWWRPYCVFRGHTCGWRSEQARCKHNRHTPHNSLGDSFLIGRRGNRFEMYNFYMF